MKQLLFIFFSFPFFAGAQNLVPNPSFEQYTSCPNNFCQIHRATGWSAWGGSPDYFNTCGTWPVSVPYNNFGNQVPDTGNGYAGFWAYDSFNSSSCGFCREYLGIQLISPLVIGQKYYVKFKVSLADKARIGINKIGVLFTTKLFSMDSTTSCTNTNTVLLPNNFAHVYTNNIITDTTNWTLISDSFVADSAYQYIAIGNHFTDTNTNYIIINSNPPCCFAYYYIDDIYVGTDSAMNIFENQFHDAISIYPNPFSLSSIVLLPETLNDFRNAWVSIHNLVGEEVYQEAINERQFTIHRNDLHSGFYLLKIYCADGMFIKKIIITN